MDELKGKSTGNHGFWLWNLGVSYKIFPSNSMITGKTLLKMWPNGMNQWDRWLLRSPTTDRSKVSQTFSSWTKCRWVCSRASYTFPYPRVGLGQANLVVWLLSQNGPSHIDSTTTLVPHVSIDNSCLTISIMEIYHDTSGCEASINGCLKKTGYPHVCVFGGKMVF